MEKQIMDTKRIEKFAIYLRDEERSAATIEKYMRDIRFFATFIGDQEITKQNVKEYKDVLSRRYTATSANSMIAALNCFLRFCGWHTLCVKQLKIQRQAYCSEEKELTKAEYIRLLTVAQARHNERLNLMIQTICGTGIRVSELQYITVEAARKGEAFVNCKGKNRRIFIVSGLKKKLLRYAKTKNIVTGMIFVTKSGKAISRNNVWKEMKSLCKEAGVSPSKVFPHNLRHLFARTFYAMEKDIAKLADILGHASINTTRIYIVTSGAEHKRKLEHMRLII
ncbi:MAG: tyrosine-type recombinase/integrase [Clostridia bacterium]|nr:tyrosine-type recombinase/integrase [Clostridia bacterium]